MGEHGWFDKRFMYEESFRTPLIMSYPGKIKSGSQSTALVQNIDYAPTFLSLAGIDKLQEMSGITLEPLFNGGKPVNWRTSLYYHYYDYPAVHNVHRHDGVRTVKYKLVHFYGKGEMRNDEDINCNELYDLEADPNELNNLFEASGYKEITKELQDILDKYRTDLKVDEF